jgi:hypothetical protein
MIAASKIQAALSSRRYRTEGTVDADWRTKKAR